ATQPLAPETGLREALSPLHGLFQRARDNLPVVTARPAAGAMMAQGYVVLILNSHLRPFLARLHPRLKAWEDSGQPEVAGQRRTCAARIGKSRASACWPRPGNWERHSESPPWT